MTLTPYDFTYQYPFSEDAKELSPELRQQARVSYKLFKQNPYHPSLHFKQIHTTKPIYSVRVGRSYRALGIRKGDTITWFWIGSHAEYDKLISQL